jgi:hypothetical protein
MKGNMKVNQVFFNIQAASSEMQRPRGSDVAGETHAKVDNDMALSARGVQ